jgi:hypothetical protein
MLILASETAIIISVPTGHHLQMQTTFAKIFDQYDQELPTPIHVDMLAKYLSGYDKTEKGYILQGFSKGFTVLVPYQTRRCNVGICNLHFYDLALLLKKFRQSWLQADLRAHLITPFFHNFMFLLWAYVRKKNQISLE